ncbi:MAG: ABC transporter substrate-binding protein [Burkholderiales bacterium]|nr:ABC transporter substrate-binding protein [Burkholderiales bacterium]
MRRREATLAMVALSCALPARAQQPSRTHRIGYLSLPSRESVEPVLQVFLRSLRDLGWVEGDNLSIAYRWADGEAQRLPQLAAELVDSNVELIVAPAAAAVLAARNATRTIPIVMVFPADPVGLGLVASLSHPGGNVTGTAYSHGAGILRKQLQILKEVVPRASSIAVLASPLDPLREIQRREFAAAGAALKLRTPYIEARGPEDFDGAFAAIAKARAEALMVAGSSTYLRYRRELGEQVRGSRLPTMYTLREMVIDAYGLMSYAANLSEFIKRSAVYVDRILRGARPADLPVEQPDKVELVINLRTARALGLTVPRAVLERADEIVS